MDKLLQTKIGNLILKTPLLNASGVWCTTKKELEELLKADTGAVVFKTMTVNPRQGNPEPRLFYKKDFSLNSMGLPNLGVDYYLSIVDDLKKFKKPLIASIAGFKKEEFYFLAEKINKSSFDAIEVNLSCPNLEGKGIFAYDLKKSVSILKNIKKKSSKLVGVKLPPYNQRDEIKELAERLVEIKVDFVTLINSLPLGVEIDWQKESFVIKPNLGIGGLGGKVIKPLALAQVYLFNYFSQGKLTIIGVGGVNKGEDVYQYILAGASAVGLGTSILNQRLKIFKKINQQLAKILKEKKVNNLKERIGQIKQL